MNMKYIPRKLNGSSLSREINLIIFFSQQRYNERPVNGFGTIVEVSGNKYEGDFIDGKK